PVEAGDVDHGVESLRGGRFVPYFARLLRSSIELEAFGGHLRAWVPVHPAIEGGTTADDLLALLSSGATAISYRALAAEIDIPIPGLTDFFQNLVQVYGGRIGRFALVLVLDQFEELFTRFVDPGPQLGTLWADLPDWRL